MQELEASEVEVTYVHVPEAVREGRISQTSEVFRDLGGLGSVRRR